MEQQQQTTNQPTLEQQIAEAEQRGYQRGLNEQIESKMREPGVWEKTDSMPPADETDGGFVLLANPSRSIWDNQLS